MGKYSRNCGSDNSGAVMESEIENSGSAKRRKISNGELILCSSESIRFTDFESADVSGDHPASCCSSNGSITANVNSVDLEVESGTTVLRESSPTSNLKEEVKTSNMESKSPATITVSRRTIPIEKMPPAAEIEEFFANAEKNLQKRFKDKYNYDIVKDVPLKGRFEWEKLKP